nr:MAG TPA: hypothetical protein [Crassvirales sp.]
MINHRFLIYCCIVVEGFDSPPCHQTECFYKTFCL